MKRCLSIVVLALLALTTTRAFAAKASSGL